MGKRASQHGKAKGRSPKDGCWRFTPYDSLEKAREAARKEGRRYLTTFSVVPCEHCGSYHVVKSE